MPELNSGNATSEIDTHFQEQKPEKSKSKNRRNGHSKKKLKGEFGEVEISVPRDRSGEFEPVIVKKDQTRFNGFDDKILSLYARGMTTLLAHSLAPDGDAGSLVIFKNSYKIYMV